MNATRKTLASRFAIVVAIALVSTALTRPLGAQAPLPQGFCDQVLVCVEGDPVLQGALEVATHDRYTDAEAVAAMDPEANDNPLNHQRYTDADAVAAMEPEGNDNPLNHQRYTDDESVAAMAPEANDNPLNHQRYTDADAVAAMDPEGNDNPLNHQRYTDDEARAAVGPGGIGGYQIVTNVVTVPTGFGATLTTTAFCPGSKKALGGGGRMVVESGLRPIVRSSPSLDANGNPDGRGWKVTWIDSGFSGGNVDLHVYCICADVP